jgi:peptidoglycan/xylan/chitin deacetylase (PgdA/CDA1 family)
MIICLLSVIKALFPISSPFHIIWSILFSLWFMSRNRCNFPETSKVNRQYLVHRKSIADELRGFGEHGHDPQWPNGARIAVSFVLNYEEGGERNPLDGDGISEPYLWEKGPSGGGREQRHLNGEQDYEYGSRCGAWRILRLMKDFGWNMTLWAIAVAMERNPTFAKACVRDGHEIGAHGYRWLDIWDYSLEDDKVYIKKTCKALEAATGKCEPRFFKFIPAESSRRIPCWCLFWPRNPKYSQPASDHVEGDGS